MLKFLRKKRQIPGMVGVASDKDRIVLAQIVTEDDKRVLRALDSVTPGKRSAGEALADTVEAHRLAGAPTTLVLAPRDYQLLLMEAPAVEGDEVIPALRWKVKDLIDFPVEEAVLDYFPVPEEAYRGKGMIYTVVMRRERVVALRDMITDSGLELAAIDIPELAMRNLARAFTDDQDGLAFLDLNPGGSTLNLSREGTLYLTRHLNTQLREDAIGTDEWAGVKDRLVLEIQRSLDYFEGQMGLPQINRLVLAPRMADSQALIDELNGAMMVPVELMDLNRTLECDGELPLARQQEGLMALGAALREQGGSA